MNQPNDRCSGMGLQIGIELFGELIGSFDRHLGH